MDRLDPDYQTAVRYLYDRINYEKTTDRPYDQRTYRLARMEHLLKELGSPQRAAPVIHVAGTKGKGSVSWLLAEGLRRNGLKVGLYTSPHLVHLEERFVLNGQACLPKDLVAQVNMLQRADEATANSQHGQPTFFEMTTAIAWNLFATHKTDVNVMEVGLGGRLDSTNVCDSALAIITSISFDHMQQLGNTLYLIAREKAGIIKPNIPVVSGVRDFDARQAIREKCDSTNSPIWELGTDFEVAPCESVLKPSSDPYPDTNRMRFFPTSTSTPLKAMDDISLRMLGHHQFDNAAVAIAAWQRLCYDGWKLKDTFLRQSIASTQLTCRIEIVSKRPTIIIDTSHNVASIQALVQTLSTNFTPTKKNIVFACSKDKEFECMLEQVMRYADRVVLTQFANNPRAVSVQRLSQIASQLSLQFPHVKIDTHDDSIQALIELKNRANPDELICATGSFFLASELRSLFPETPKASFDNE